MSTYFISDIHLQADSAARSRLLLDFLHTRGPSADAIYILGDLFAIWLGDDLAEPYAQELFATLHQLSKQNIPLFFMRGNRDFLIGNKFCQATGCKLLPDPCLINLYGQQVLVTHGDLLCTADLNYQRFRQVVQNPLVKALFLALPKFFRHRLGMWVKSKTKRPAQNLAVYDVVPTTVQAWFAKFHVTLLIHGHTHLPAMHNDGANTRIVLGDWNDSSAKILVCTPEGYALQDLLAIQPLG